MREQLDVLVKLAHARLDGFQSQLEIMFLDREGTMKRTVPGRRALRFERHVGLNVGEKQEDGTLTLDAERVIKQSVHGYFQTAAKTTSQAGASAYEGFKSVVTTGLKSAVENTTAGESTERKFFVCIHHNAVVRVDIMTYRYNFRTTETSTKTNITSSDAGANSAYTNVQAGDGVNAQTGNSSDRQSSVHGTKSTSFSESYKNVFAYILCISVVDHNEITDDELIYLASEFAGDDVKEFGAYLDQLVTVWRRLHSADRFKSIAG